MEGELIAHVAKRYGMTVTDVETNLAKALARIDRSGTI